MGMEADASKVLNEEVKICAVVASKGTGGRTALTAGIGGVVGVVAGEMVGRKKDVSSVSDHKGYMILAAGPSKVAFFVMKRGLLSNGIGNLLVEHPREEISLFEVDSKGLATSAVSMEFKDGSSYALEVPRASKGKLEKFQKELGF